MLSVSQYPLTLDKVYFPSDLGVACDPAVIEADFSPSAWDVFGSSGSVCVTLSPSPELQPQPVAE